MFHASDGSDSDTSLPDLSHLLKGPEVIPPFKSGDIVLAKFKNCYWPALIRTVYTKQNKIAVWYCDEPGKTFKMSIKHIVSFWDKKKRSEIQKLMLEAGYLRPFEELCSHAMRFVKRRNEGYIDDPRKYFDQEYPFFLIEKMLKKDPNADVSQLKIPPMYILNMKKSEIRKLDRKKTEIISKNDDDREEIFSTDGEEVSESEPVDLNLIPSIFKTAPVAKRCINELAAYIFTGKADNYLTKILSKTIKSEYFDLHEQAAGKKNFGKLSFIGPIEDSNTLSKITCHLQSFFDNYCKNLNNTGSYNIKLTQATLYTKVQEADIISSVLLPESIICAIGNVYGISLPEAKDIFQSHPESYKETFDNLAVRLEASTSNIKVDNLNIDNQVMSYKVKTNNSKSETVQPRKKRCL